MRNIYLIFRRDYLGYVRAWGFWLSLAAVPLFMIIGGAFALFAAKSSPVRYYAVVEPAAVYADAIEGEFALNDEDTSQQARDLAANMDLSPEQQAALQSGNAAPPRKFILVPAPARSIDDLRPYLMGQRLVSGPLGDKPLFAVFIPSADGRDLEYWSDDVNVGALRATAANAMRRLARQQALSEAGLGADFLDKVDASALQVSAHRIRTVADQTTTGSAVTMADRAPVFVAGGLAYFLWLMIFSIIQYLLMGTIEERSNKIFDTLLTSVKLTELLAGKLLAVFAVTSTMMLSWGLFAFGASLFATSQPPVAFPRGLRQSVHHRSGPDQLPAGLCHVRHDLHGAGLALRHDPGSADPAQPDDDPAYAANVRHLHRVPGSRLADYRHCVMDSGVYALPLDLAHAARSALVGNCGPDGAHGGHRPGHPLARYQGLPGRRSPRRRHR